MIQNFIKKRGGRGPNTNPTTPPPQPTLVQVSSVSIIKKVKTSGSLGHIQKMEIQNAVFGSKQLEPWPSVCLWGMSV